MIKSNKFQSIERIKDSLILIARSKLNKNQKKALIIIFNLGSINNATQLANKISKEAGLSLSTSWNIIRVLRNFKLLSLEQNNISLTESGKIICVKVSKEAEK